MRVFGGDGFRLDGLDPDSLKAFTGMTEKIVQAGIMPPSPGNNPPPPANGEFSMTVGDKTFSVDPKDQKSISAFFNAEVEETGPDGQTRKVLLSKNPKTRTEHARIYGAAIRAKAAADGL